MNERKFIEELQNRAKQQEQLVSTVPFPSFFGFIVRWLSFHPWRLLIPLAIVLTILFRFIIGPSYTNMILALFRWI